MAFRRRRKRRSIFRVPAVRPVLKWGWRLFLLLILVDGVYLVWIWPDWEAYRQGPIQQSRFMLDYETKRQGRRDWPQLRWRPVALERIPKHLVRAVIVAEDSRFFEHDGVDLDALQQAMEYNLSAKRMVYGGSTLSQQTAKNLFLNASRNPLRKWHELVLTLAMEQNLPKRRILEHYLNVAEFGRGIYGVGAAAQYYWDVPVSRITPRESIELAATLPSPVANNPRSNTRAFKNRVKKIRRYF